MTTDDDETMTADEYCAALEKLDITQQAAGRLFGVGQRTAGRWAQGITRIPVTVGLLLNLMVKKRLKLEVPIWNKYVMDFDKTQIWKFSAERKME